MSTIKVNSLQKSDGTDFIFSERNKLINGDFSVAQRGTSFTSTDSANNNDVYTLDRWYILSDGNDVVDVTQNTSAVPTNQLYAIALDVETANKKFGIAQIISNKNIVDLKGNEVTLSFKAKVSDASKLDNVKAAIVAWSGTADTVTSNIINAWNSENANPTPITNATFENTPANLNVTTSWVTYTVTATVDTSGTNNIIVFIWSDVTDTTAGHFLYLTDIQLEKGPTNTPFERKSYDQQLLDCQVYFYSHADIENAPIGMGSYYQNTYVSTQIGFPTTMRTPPTSIVVTNDTNDFIVYRNSGNDPIDTLVRDGNSLSKNMAEVYATGTQVSGTAGQIGTIRVNGASGGKLQFDSEL